jgi:hypothetical protein
MKIVGCDLHTRYQQIAMLDQETGELVERRVAQAFDLVGITNTEGCPVLRVLCEGREPKMLAQVC